MLTWRVCIPKMKLISPGIQKLSIFSLFLKNLYKTLFWLVGPIKLIWFDLVPQREHVYQVSLIFDQKQRNYRSLKFFLWVSIQVGRAGRQINGATSMKFLWAILGSKTDLHTKFQPNRTMFAEVIPFYRILAGSLVGLVFTIRFQKNLSLKSRRT